LRAGYVFLPLNIILILLDLFDAEYLDVALEVGIMATVIFSLYQNSKGFEAHYLHHIGFFFVAILIGRVHLFDYPAPEIAPWTFVFPALVFFIAGFRSGLI
jgi:hypothetical protein